jgi:hypothetical protein
MISAFGKFLPRPVKLLIRSLRKQHTRAVDEVMLTFIDSLFQMHLIEAFVKVVSAKTGKSRFRTAVVGLDAQLLRSMEIIADLGLDVHAKFDGRPSTDPFHPSQPLHLLKPQDFEFILISYEDSSPRTERCDGGLENLPIGADKEKCAVLNLNWLDTTLKATLCRLKSLNSSLNDRKLLFVAACLSLTMGEGCVVECGAYLCGTTIVMGLLLSQWQDKRKIYAIDTFVGMPAPVLQDGKTVYQAGTFNQTSYDFAQNEIAVHRLKDKIAVRAGMVQEVLPRILEVENEISFALVDTDQYAGTIASLTSIWPRLRKDGLILVDDSNLQGVKQAIAEARILFPDLCVAEMTFNLSLLWKKLAA